MKPVDGIRGRVPTIVRCSVCDETMTGLDYDIPEITGLYGVSIQFEGKMLGIKLRRHKGTKWIICYDCWLDSLGVKK